jgi:hypothetical protein
MYLIGGMPLINLYIFSNKISRCLDLYYTHLSQTLRCALEKIDPNDWKLAEICKRFLKSF